MSVESEAAGPSAGHNAERTVIAVLMAISASHMMNDTIQSLVPAIYPILKSSYALEFSQIGLITLAFQLTASLLQPIVGLYTDRFPQPYSLAVGMGFTLCGLLLLSVAASFPMLLVSVALIGIGSSVFHPEASRVARMASGGRHGFAQSLFQVGGNTGSAIGPLLAAFIVLPHGQQSVAWFSAIALVGIVVLSRIGAWYQAHRLSTAGRAAFRLPTPLPRPVVVRSIAILAILVFSKFFYMASLSSYFTFYLIDTFHVSVKDAQLYLFLFLAASAVGTFVGGPIGDRFGRKFVIWLSILGALPFTLALPWVNLFWTAVLSVVIGLVISSAFAAIIVFAQELVPGKVGMISGLFFGFAFGMGGIGAAALGELADLTSIRFVYEVCAFLPAIGLLAVFLPNLRRRAA